MTLSRAKRCGLAALLSLIICVTIFINFFSGNMDNLDPDVSIGFLLLTFVLSIVFSLSGLWSHFKPHCNCSGEASTPTPTKPTSQQSSEITSL
jgi:hypothetical protein